MMNLSSLERQDPEVATWIHREWQRQNEGLELIASENFTSPAVLEAVGSILTNKYAEGYPERRYYGGCKCVDTIENLAIERAQRLFGAEHANVQPHSGTQANLAVYTAVLKPGDKILTLSLENGGHLTHGHPKNLSGMLYQVSHYDVDPQTAAIDYEALEEIALRERPQLITIGASAYPKVIDFQRVGEVARASGALLLADIAHIAGLVVTGLHPSPIPHADFVTTTTHKTLRGPRGGLILCREKWARAIDASVFPGNQGGPLMHVIAGKAVCFGEALRPEFRDYQRQILANARALAEELQRLGLCLVGSGTENHLLLLDLRPSSPDLSGRAAAMTLETAGITVNANTVPRETRNPFQASGLRLGTPAVTTRGMREAEMKWIAVWIEQILSSPEDEALSKAIRAEVRKLCQNFPLRY
ncbi:MAG: serine hydroxymethyltransferase [Puniceicoccales bacterium]|jgi:glycine hydroxymethyltransferase|nr:serine hydroxymethyltransferase [Puniceicoccales bacterium]